MTESKFTLTHRLELERELLQVRRENEAHAVRRQAREEVGREIVTAQAAVVAAEEAAFKNLPTPLPENAGELIAQYPVVAGRRHQLERFESVYAAVRIEHAEAVAKAITGESGNESSLTPSPKPNRRVKQSGTDGGSP